MNTKTLDEAIKRTTTAETTLGADKANLDNLEAAAAQAAAPVPPAKAKVAVDIDDFNASLRELSDAALAAVIPVSVPE